ncbi:hypothetical protein QJS10_CPB15g00464 [Acorus calamus]|uniref:J domain-containing protein n=1 Tax=Acorus calamus TaxID=4465 RepID=A0AAV9D660_ACOCL|nr:hypothetical protein QJS10_CPB15g00464 [Acorus calamus]
MLGAATPTTNSRFFGSPITIRPPSSSSPSPPLSPTTRSPRVSAVYTTASSPTAAAVEPRPSPSASLYDVLGIPAFATCQEIKAAYRSLALTCHPDTVAAGRASSGDEFMRVHAAYSTLSDPAKRADYDRGLFRFFPAGRSRGGRSPRPSPAAASHGGRRTWETDQCW